MKKALIFELLDKLQSELDNLPSPEQRAAKLKELLEIELQKNKNFNLLLGAQKGLTEMFQEMNKMELTQEIEIAILFLEHFETTGKFNLISFPQNELSNEMADKSNNINSKLKSIVE